MLPPNPEKRRGKRGVQRARRAYDLDAQERAEGLRMGDDLLFQEPFVESAVEGGKPRTHELAPAHRVSTDLTQLGAELRLEMVCYAVGSLRSIGEEWSYFEPERRFSLSLTWQYLVTGSLPALHRHYLLERMTREQCASYESFLKELGRSRRLLERLGLFPPWRTLESVTAETVLEREIPGKLARHSRTSLPAGRHPDGRRRLHKRLSDRLGGAPRREG